MLINKITTGFVVQVFDTATNKYISQWFCAGDQVDVETSEGEPVGLGRRGNLDMHYLPFEMKQP